jgi:hypothetical protein
MMGDPLFKHKPFSKINGGDCGTFAFHPLERYMYARAMAVIMMYLLK